ncbi:hypothetical protein [Streptomyces xylophagus]|uniref:hypothetical protein n=1 Tax=Streptomyces xylophagus TaxID=285514 RepID=UPI0005BD2C7B|nr:hypothetical protein [Streptomyces xylophagus]
MTADEQAALAEGMWRATDLMWAYLTEDRTRVSAGLEGLDSDQLAHTLAWQARDHDWLFDDLGEPSMSVPLLDTVAALAPVDCEFMMTTAVRKGVAAGTGLASSGLADFPPAAQIHALTVCMAVMLLEAHGRQGALEFAAASADNYVRRGHPRPYPTP